jgi:hypothetical protein
LNEEGLSFGDHYRGLIKDHLALPHQQISKLLDQIPMSGSLDGLGELIFKLSAEGREPGLQPLKVGEECGGIRVQGTQKSLHFSDV